MQSHCYSSTLVGIEAKLVRVEVAVSNGLPGLTVVGLPDAAVSEAGARVRSALRASGFQLPPRRLVINLSPADLRKHGSGFDLALALGLLEAMGELPQGTLARSLVLGELSLDGSVRPIKGVIPSYQAAVDSSEIDRFLMPTEPSGSSVMWAGAVGVGPACDVIPVSTLREAVDVLTGRVPAPVQGPLSGEQPRTLRPSPDLNEVKGQTLGRWGLELAAAGGHHLMMVGPPGCGKSLLASCLPGLLPSLNEREWFEVAAIASVCQDGSFCGGRPFRAPGHGTSAVALLGGQQPGEVTRAHQGVLFLDEFPEFRRDALEALRRVVETGVVSIVRARMRVIYPASFTLVAAMNPCPCGMYTPLSESCTCTLGQRLRYSNKFSGPLRDRIDLLVSMERQPLTSYLETGGQVPEGTAAVRERVQSARALQTSRGCLNRDLRGSRLRESLNLTQADELFCQSTGDRLDLSVRGFEKWLKVARTIADLASEKRVYQEHLMTALALRTMETRTAA